MSGDGPELCANAYCREPLDDDETAHPARCGAPVESGKPDECLEAICDECAAAVMIPATEYGDSPQKGYYDALVCSTHFREEWV